MVSTSFLTDISNFEDFDSSHSFRSDNDPLTSTPKKLATQQGTQSEALPDSPLPPPFQLIDKSSIESFSIPSEQSTLEFNDSDVNKDSTTKSSPGQ